MNDMSKKLYVGNLSFQTTESDLDALFAQMGDVESVRIITDRNTGQSRGFGFVEMNSEGATKAIDELNGKEVDGRALTVNEARPQENRGNDRGFGGGGGGGGGRKGYSRY
jgi:RNA recognition motif-containing protein